MLEPCLLQACFHVAGLGNPRRAPLLHSRRRSVVIAISILHSNHIHNHNNTNTTNNNTTNNNDNNDNDNNDTNTQLTMY